MKQTEARDVEALLEVTDFQQLYSLATRCPQSCLVHQTRLTSKVAAHRWCYRLVETLKYMEKNSHYYFEFKIKPYYFVFYL